MALLPLLLLVGLCARPAYAAATGRIDGALVEQTPGTKLQAGGSATLYDVTDGQNPKQQSKVTIPASGTFSFSGFPADPAHSWQVLVDYAGASYVTNKLTFAVGKPRQTVRLGVYEPTADDSLLTIDATNIVLTPPDASTHEIPVLELDTVVNGSQRAFIPSTTPRNGGPPNLLRFSLPPDASQLAPASGIDPRDIIQISTGFGVLTPLLPGQTNLDFSFRAPYTSSTLTFSKSIIYPTKALRVLAPMGALRIASPQLGAASTQKIGSQNYQVLTGTNLRAGSVVQLEMSSLPGISPLAFLSQPQALVGIAVVLALAVLLLLAWYVRDRVRSRRAASLSESSEPARRALELQQRELLIALARLDDRYEAGGISQQEYQAQRDVQKAELRDLMNALGEPEA